MPQGTDRPGAGGVGRRPRRGGPLYDARRGVYYARPALRDWLHLLCFWASLAGGAALLARAQITAAAVYSANLSALLGTSTLYHRGTWTAAWRLRLRHLDQAMIFFLIAGTATPAFLLSAPVGPGLAGLRWRPRAAVGVVSTPAPRPACCWWPAACQYAAIARFIG